ncbi:thiopeptide-type bacteriocin biosynthesis protein [Marivirga sp. S37H4]|uniref:Thiopeptide-type bacteriocin biosynthesis protein n=1 Tax=Marivirga aurantiaca TaxID=2802615 RepID=A0A934WYW4_9BACT|nr:thiopeptide-type bacteriocin biosynthesis protein [Marivirga aurantiaca]MBK6265325.1 thiopeptide-type bacteriocin biosynthesis protein [Marivirga aurantiaca]
MLIVRSPILHFNFSEIDSHYDLILNKIKHSSSSLYHSIRHREIKELTTFEKNKVFKYYLRGRYRATPFGGWSCMGIAEFDNDSHLEVSSINEISFRDYSSIHEDFVQLMATDAHLVQTYSLPSVWHLNDGKYTFLEFDFESKKYKWSSIDRNPVLDRIISYCKKYGSLQKASFKGFFDDAYEEEMDEMWSSIIGTGFLVPANFLTTLSFPLVTDNAKENGNSHLSYFIDSILDSPTTLKKSIRGELDKLPEEAAYLFEAYESGYLKEYSKTFRDQFDDRFTPFCMAVGNMGRNLPDPQVSSGNKELRKSNVLYEESREEIKLLPQENSALSYQSEIFNVLFRLGENQQLILEHFSVGFSIGLNGRFGHCPRVYGKLKGLINDLKDKNVIYADIETFDKPEYNNILKHKPVTEYVLKTISPVMKETDLALKDLLIGVDSKNKFILYHKILKKRIIPIIHSAFNYRLTTNPVLTLLYEIANQYNLNSKSFAEFSDSQGNCPRITFKNFILSPRTWNISYEKLSIDVDLKKAFEILNYPHQFLFGEFDKEFYIDLNERNSLEFFETELKKKGEIIIKECLWDHDFTGQNGKSIYPQWNYTKILEKPEAELSVIPFVNAIEKENKKWLYFKIFFFKNSVEGFSLDNFFLKLDKMCKKLGIDFFYIAYSDPVFHLRIRFRLNEAIKKDVEKEILYFLYGYSELSQISKAPYYPEFSKYGKKQYPITESVFILETAYLLKNDFFNKDYLDRVVIMTDLFQAIFFEFHEIRIDVFRTYYDTLIKRNIISTEDRNSFKKDYESYQENLSTEDTDFCDTYRKLIKNYPIKGLDKVILNHMHVFINRAFLEKSARAENQIYYNLNRLLLKLIYSPK